MSELYHFTTSCHLPRIIRSGGLTVPRYTSGHGHRDFIWATADPNGERTAAGAIGTWGKAYRDGDFLKVRLTLDGDGFAPWRDVISHHWSPAWIDRYEATARGCRQSTETWQCRENDLPLAH